MVNRYFPKKLLYTSILNWHYTFAYTFDKICKESRLFSGKERQFPRIWKNSLVQKNYLGNGN